MKEALIEIFNRDIQKLRDEVNNYEDEKILWITVPGISNSAGNLSLHLVGNLNHFIGAVLGKNGYKRERDLEFSLKDIPLVKLNDMIEKTKDIVLNTLSAMTEKEFELDFPELKHDKVLKTDFMLIHLLAHFNYHLGQINYHRRLLEK
jgi:hypothetical protein